MASLTLPGYETRYCRKACAVLPLIKLPAMLSALRAQNQATVALALALRCKRQVQSGGLGLGSGRDAA